MKKQLYRFFALFTVLLFVLANAPLTALADDGQPGFVAAPTAKIVRNGEHISFSVSTVHSANRRARTQSLPSSYRLSSDRLTSVKDQDPYGTCWAHAAYASAESIAKSEGLITNPDPDFSEWQLAYYTYTSQNGLPAFDLYASDSPYDEGGDDDMSTAMMARGSSPILESEAPYGGSTPSASIKPKYDLKETYVGHTPDEWKQLIMSKGALTLSFCYDNSYYKSQTYSYYDPNADYSNHEIAVVGWDDSYAVTNFRQTPPGPGAWIMKNSWGTGWGQNGYFYMSYYDQSLEADATAYELTARPSGEREYTYDELGMDDMITAGNNTGYIKCVYTAVGAETLSSVGTYAVTDSTAYGVMVTTQDPYTGQFLPAWVSYQTGTVDSAGYARISLAKPVPLAAGQKYEVILHLTTPNYNYPMPIEEKVDYLSTQARFAPGQSFASSNGTSWTDLYAYSWDASIFAFTTPSGPPTHTVTFDSQGGSAVSCAYVLDNAAVPKPADPTKTGYTFAGWYKESGCANAWNFNTDTVTDDITLYAKWTVNNYTVTFDSQGGSAVTAAHADYNTLVSSPADPAKTGYTFAGWYKEQGCATPWNFNTDVVTGNITLWAKWTINNYTVTFDSQGGSAVAAAHADYNTPVSRPADPAKTGYTFAGWYKESGCANAWNFDSDKVTGNLTLFANWTVNTYAVTFDSQGGSAVDPAQAAYNALIALPAKPSKDGFVFGGWYKEAACATQWLFKTDRVTSDVTLYARWNDAPYTVTYDSQGASAVDPVQAIFGSTLSAPPDPSLAGFVFDGWYREPSCQHKWDFASDTVLDDTTLFAKWHFGSLAAPQNASAASASATSILVSWDAVPGAAGYMLQRATSATGPWSILPMPIGTSYTDTNLTTNQVYYYRVCAGVVYHSSTYYGAFCTAVSSTPLPPAPVLSASATSYNSIRVSWAAVPGAAKVELYRATAENGSYKLLTATTALYYNNTGLATGQPYYYKAVAYCLVGGKKVYGAPSTVVSATAVLSAPTAVSAASASYSSVKITWGSVAGKSGYEVWRCATVDGTYQKVGSTSSTSYTDKNLATGTPYYYEVIAYRTVSGKKVPSACSSPVSATPVPATPKAKAARASSSSVKVSWGSVAGASGYEVEIYVQADGKFELLADTNKTSSVSSGLLKGTVYRFRVRAYRLVGGEKVYSGYSSEVSAKPY